MTNSCMYAYDGMCDEPSLCAYGTDSNDCWSAKAKAKAKAKIQQKPAMAKVPLKTKATMV